MKKQKFMKLSAFTSDPELGNSFSAPATHDGEVSVVFRDKDISIHGWDGSAWTTIYTWNGLDKQFTFNNTYQNYFLKSLTGSQETMGVSFFSTSRYQGSTPSLAGIDRDVKFHDVDEVPIYTSSDDGKFLTVRSDGSLAWLGLNESYVVEVIGTGDEGGGSSFTPTGAGTFLEEFTMFGGGALTDGVLSTSAATPSYYKKSGMVAPSTTATTAVFSMWFNPEQSQMGLYSDQHYPLQVDFGLRMFSSSLLHISTPIGGANGVTLSTPLTLNEWHHALVTVETDIAYTSTSSKSMTVKLYIDGQEVYTKTGNSSSKRIRAYAGIANGTKHYIGAENYNGSVSYKGNGQFDFMEWVDDVTLSDAQILAMYNGGTRGWSVADAVASGEGASAGSIVGLESSATLYGDANLSNGSLVLDGTGDYAVIDDGFRFTDKMTTSVWFKTTATGDRRIYSSHVRGLSGGDFRNGFFARLNDGQLKYRHPAGGTGELTGPSGLNDGAWHHLALSWEASVGYTLYVDGVQAGSGGSSVSDGYVSGWGLYIGANPWNNNDPYALFEGEIKKFEVLNEVLTSQQVTDRFNEG